MVNAFPVSSRLIAAVFLLAASALNLWVMWHYPLSGDILFQETFLSCFSEQFWSGNLYPRWCWRANAAEGAPLFHFYFPLPFWISSLLAPFLPTGEVELGLHYKLTASLATLVTAWGSYRWLREHHSLSAACVGAFFFLFAPYRMEVLHYRAAVAEIWCLALFPWALLTIEKMIAICEEQAESPPRSVFTACGVRHAALLSLYLAAALLCHLSTALVLWWVCLIRAALSPAGRGRMLAGTLLAQIVALLATSFYWIPAMVYEPAVQGRDFLRSFWANDFLRAPESLADFLQYPNLIALAVLLPLLTHLAWGWRKLVWASPSGSVERRGWAVPTTIFALTFPLLFPVTAPLWKLIEPFFAAFPWRMQAALLPVLALLAAGGWQAQRRIRDQRHGWRPLEWAVIGSLLFLLGAIQISTPAAKGSQWLYTLRPLSIASVENNSRWMPPPHFPENLLLFQFQQGDYFTARARLPHLTAVRGEIRLKDWEIGPHGVHLAVQVDSAEGAELALRYRYFPSLWLERKTPQGWEALAMQPEEGSGMIRFHLPPGLHELRLREEMLNPSAPQFLPRAWLLPYAWPLAGLGWLIFAGFLMVCRLSLASPTNNQAPNCRAG